MKEDKVVSGEDWIMVYDFNKSSKPFLPDVVIDLLDKYKDYIYNEPNYKRDKAKRFFKNKSLNK